MYVKKIMCTREMGKRLGVTRGCILNWLKKYNIPIRSNKPMSTPEFRDFLRENKTALNLAGAALLMSASNTDIKSVILETYQNKFKDISELDSLLKNNRQEIYDILKEGITNLGTYIGGFSLTDRTIIPVLIGEALTGIPADKVTSSLEERVVRILRNEYGPAFNENTQGTLRTIENLIEKSEGKVRTIYQKLHNHYQEVLQLGEELICQY